jgi:hypothetical protein
MFFLKMERTKRQKTESKSDTARSADDARFVLAGYELYRDATHVVMSFLDLVDYGALATSCKRAERMVSNYFQTGLRSIVFPSRDATAKRTVRGQYDHTCRLLQLSARRLLTIKIDSSMVNRLLRTSDFLLQLVQHNATTLESLAFPLKSCTAGTEWTAVSTVLQTCPRLQHANISMPDDVKEGVHVIDTHLGLEYLQSLAVRATTNSFAALVDCICNHPNKKCVTQLRWEGPPVHVNQVERLLNTEFDTTMTDIWIHDIILFPQT